MTSERKKELKKLILGFFAYCALTIVVFFMCFAIPPVALAAPAPLWTFYGFQILQFITKKTITLNYQKLSATLNFFFFLTAEFAFPLVIDVGDEGSAKIIRAVAILLFVGVIVLEIFFWKRLLSHLAKCPKDKK